MKTTKADNGFSQNNPDCESSPCIVTLSTFASLSVNSAKGLSRWAPRCFAAAQHDKAVILTDVRFIL
jgi:hypothetical protein